jgi:hypothetical protein
MQAFLSGHRFSDAGDDANIAAFSRWPLPGIASCCRLASLLHFCAASIRPKSDFVDYSQFAG